MLTAVASLKQVEKLHDPSIKIVVLGDPVGDSE